MKVSFQNPALLKIRNLLPSNNNLFTCSRIPGLLGCTGSDPENTKIPHFNNISYFKSFFHGFKKKIDDFFGFAQGKAWKLAGEAFDEVEVGQWSLRVRSSQMRILLKIIPLIKIKDLEKKKILSQLLLGSDLLL